MKIKWKGKEIKVVELEITNANEKWNEYDVSDGSVIKVKLVASKIVRALEEKNDIGEPLYLVSSSNVVSVKVNPELMEDD